MLQNNDGDLSPQDKKLLNILQIKMYDISQNVEILSKQLTPTQIKDIVAQTYSIFSQLKHVFERCDVPFLYNIVRKMQINSLLMTSILTDKLEKQPKQEPHNKNVTFKENTKATNDEDNRMFSETKYKTVNKKIQHLGGVCLYNQHYRRGIEYEEANQIDYDQSNRTSRQKTRVFKRYKEQFLTSIMEEIDNKAEVQVQSINDQIKNYILNYKENSKVANFISCQKQLGQIIDFFKISELQAINFLNKSPNSNQYTQDYINRLNDLERDIKVKEDTSKGGILQKMKVFIDRLKQKMSQIQKSYQQKNAKLMEYQRTLKKVTVTLGTQTYDNYQRRIKQLQGKLKQQQQKYKILNEMRKVQHNYQDQIHNLINQIQMKNNQLKKVQQINSDLQQQLQAFKKIIRQNKQKLNIPLQFQRRKAKTRNKIPKEVSTKKINDINKNQKNQTKAQDRQLRQSRSSELRQFRPDKKIRKYQKIGTYASSGYRSSVDGEGAKQTQKRKEELQQQLPQPTEQNQTAKYQAIKYQTTKIQQTKPKTTSQQPQSPSQSQESKESIFKAQFKKTINIKKVTQQESKVSFKMPKSPSLLISQQQLLSRPEIQQDNQDDIIKQRSVQNSRSVLSIEATRLDQEQEVTRRSDRKNALRQKIDQSASSIKEIQYFQSKKSSKSVSKKCIIIKQKKQKQKNIIATSIKFSNFAINQQFSLVIKQLIPNNQKDTAYLDKHKRVERPSYPFSVNSKSNNYSEDSFKNSLAHSKKRIKGIREVDVKKRTKNFDQPNKSNKSLKDIMDCSKNPYKEQDLQTYNRQTSKEQDLTIKKRQISNKNRTSIKRDSQVSQHKKQLAPSQQKVFIGNFTKPIQKTQKKNSFKKQSKTGIKFQTANNYKKIAACLQMLKNQQLSSITQQKWKDSLNNSISQQNSTMINYIMEQLQHDQLNLEQFKQILRTVGENQRQNSQQPDKKVILSEHSQREIEQKQARQTEHCHQHVQSHKNTIALIRKFRQTKQPSKFHQRCFNLDGISILKLKQIHSKYSKCTSINKQHRLCHHIQKYVSIIKKVNQLTLKIKIPLKLPIQKIGCIQDEIEEDRKQNLNRIDQKRSLQRKDKFSKTVDQMPQNYMKAHINTEQPIEQQKPRILPLISSTTSTYYKPKSKIIR